MARQPAGARVSTLARFEITTDPVGPGSVVINGEDVSDRVSGVAVVAEAGQPTVVTLRHLAGSAEISGEGIVKVVEEGDAVVSFLEDVSVTELERATLEGLGPGSGSPIAEALGHLKRWARGG